jgi:hypothetical protein
MVQWNGAGCMELYMDEKGEFRKGPATKEDLATWATAFQQRYFPGFDVPGMQIAIDVEQSPRAPSVYYPEKKLIAISQQITPFHELTKIALLHEMIHVKLYAENQDADEAHGARFQEEMNRLMGMGAYSQLL